MTSSRSTIPLRAFRCLGAIFWLTFSSALHAASFAAAQTTQATQPADTPSEGPIAWSVLDAKAQNQLIALLGSKDWPVRAFALMRLEHYSGEQVQERIRLALKDPAWQVRCFAIRQAARQEVAIPAGTFDDEREPRVIRAALRAGTKPSAESVTRVAAKLLRTKGIEELLLGLEIAAASDDESLRADAAKRLATLIQNMDETVHLLAARRLATMLNLVPAPETLAAWNLWLRSQPQPLELPKRGGRLNVNTPPPLVAVIDDETFARLLDYLDVLAQHDLDLAIVIDSTSSMAPMIDQARAGVDSLILFLSDLSREMRVAVIGYRDRDNPPVWDGQPLTGDIKAVRDYLFRLRISGGADFPEDVLAGLDACHELKWNKKATREIVLVGDAPPHEEDIYKARRLLESYRDSGVITHSVHVPMKMPEGRPMVVPGRDADSPAMWLENYNRTTGEVFASLAEAGGGKSTTLKEGDQLVLSIMHFTIEEAWWSTFDEFYEQYLQACR